MSSEVSDLERFKRKISTNSAQFDDELFVDFGSTKKLKMDDVEMTEIQVQIHDSCMSSSPSSSMSSSVTSTPLSSLCSPAIVRIEPSNLKEWLNMFRNWSNSERFSALDSLVTTDMCEVQQMRHLLSLIEPQLQRDFISLLPKELSLHVLSYLSPQDLLNAAQTCRAWRILCEDNLLWREKCLEENILQDPDSFWGVKDKNVPSSSTPASSAQQNNQSKCEEFNVQQQQQQQFQHHMNDFQYSEYKLGYLRSKSVELNWRHGVINYTPDEENLVTNSSNNGRAPAAAAVAASVAGNNSSANSSLSTKSSTNPLAGGAAKKVRELRKVLQLKGHEEHVITCLQFNPHSNLIVSGSDDNTLKVWSSQTGKCIRTLNGHTGGVWSSQLSPNNVVISGSTDRSLRVWCAMTGVCKHVLYGHTSTVRCMSLHGKTVVSGSRDATLRVWDIGSGMCKHVLVGHLAAVRCVQFNGKICVSGAYDYMVKVWDVETETCLHTLEGHTNRVYSLQFDGRHIVSGSLDTSIRVWDAQSGQLKHTLIGHQSLTSGMQLRGNILVSGNADSTVKVWDINTGKCLQTLSGANKHQSAVTCLQFNANFVITSSDDGTVKLWDLKTGEFIRNLISLPSGGSGGVVWRIRASNTKLVCAVGSRNGTEETKLLVLDFEQPNMFFDNYSPDVIKSLKRLQPLSHPTPGVHTIDSLDIKYMPMFVMQVKKPEGLVRDVVASGGWIKGAVHIQPIAGTSSNVLVLEPIESSEAASRFIEIVDQNDDSLPPIQSSHDSTPAGTSTTAVIIATTATTTSTSNAKNERRKHEENKDSDGSPAKKQARSEGVKSPDPVVDVPGSSKSSSSSASRSAQCSSSASNQSRSSPPVEEDSD